MRITIDIDEKTIREIQKITGMKKKSPALNQALRNYLRSERKRRLIGRVLQGETDYSLTNEELEERPRYDAD